MIRPVFSMLARSFPLVVALLVILLLAGSIDRLELHPGEKAVFTSEEPAGPAVLQEQQREKRVNIDLPAWILGLVFIPFIYLIYRHIRIPDRAPAADRRWVAYLLFLGGVLVVIGLFSLLIFQFQGMGPDRHPLDLFRDPSLIFDPSFPQKTTLWHVISVVLLIVISAAILLMARLFLSGARPDTAVMAKRLADELARAAGGIGAGETANRMIIDCYENMCRVLNEHQGVDRQASMTAREFSAELQRLGFVSEGIVPLTDLFQRARYSDAPFTPEESDAAVRCLNEIIHDYAEKSGK